MIVAMLAATALLVDSATAAQPAAAPAKEQPAAAEPAKKREASNLVCRSEPVLGSRLPTKKCRTSEEAQRDRQEAQSDLSRAQGAMANNPH